MSTSLSPPGPAVTRPPSRTSPPAQEYAARHRERFLSELAEFVRFPTVSSDPRHAGDLRACAAWLCDRLRGLGLRDVRLLGGPGHPAVYARSDRRPGRPTLLVYGHYDVQPAGPAAEWETPPFEPVVLGGALRGRGTSDDKGQLFCHVKAIESYLRTSGELPVNVRCLFEGEEEIGSPNLPATLTRHRELLACDVAVASDTRMRAPGRPALVHSLRGSLALEITVSGPSRDLHSGTFGGAVHNPIQALCELLAGLHDGRGRVVVPGFYDRVRPVGEAERAYMARTGPGDRELLRPTGMTFGTGERGFSAYEQTTIRPALTINGISGGHQGPGSKSIIPARAVAKVGFRLVPDQCPAEIERLVRRHIAAIAPPTVTVQIDKTFFASPTLVERSHPAMRAAARACRATFGRDPILLRSGGTIPAVNAIRSALEVPTVLMGFALPGSRLHAPNERFDLGTFGQGISTCIAFLAELVPHGAPGWRR